MPSDDELPSWARAGRAGWNWIGQQRPPFAVVPGPEQESVWDYPRPPRLLPERREVIVALGQSEIARTSAAIRMLETAHPPTFYLPRQHVELSYLERASGISQCEWKGTCTYYDVVIANRRLARMAWSYEHPFADAAAIAGYVACYASVLECYVAGERARPQPGGVYGGWVTSELVGPFKGDATTRGW